MRSLALAALVVAAPLSTRAGAGPTEVVVCYPAGPVTEKEAKPAMDGMLRVLERLGGWPPGSLHASFTSELGACRTLMAKRPPFVITSLGLYLEEREALALVPLATPRMGGRTTESYRLLVRKGTAKNVGDLEGKSLGGAHLEEPLFLSRVVFGGELDVAGHFKLVPSRRALKALRELAAGTLDAVLVSEQEYAALAALPFAAEIEVLFTSRPLPLLGVAASEKQTSAAERTRLTGALSGMCADAEGKKLCALFGIDGFTAATAADYDGVIAAWAAKKPR